MKKVLSLLVISIMMLSLAACGGSGDSRVITGQITIGNTTQLSGDWITYFQNNAADNDVLNFISGYPTVDINFEGEYVIDETTVKDYEVIDNADGTKTYVFEINKGLKWHDGEEVTAADYVGGILLWNSKFLGDLNGSNTGSLRLQGHREYSRGESDVFSGVRLLDDYKFSVTISADYVPFFYELAMVSYGPTKVSYWLGEDIEVVDTEDGAKFSEELTLDKFQTTFQTARDNPLYPASGPYYVESFDNAASQAVLKINENYAGNFEGQLPSIETIIYKRVVQETQFDELATGAVDVIIQSVSGDDINAGLDLVEQGGFDFVDYPRSGYGKIHFVTDHGPTQFVKVRQAIAHLIDRGDFAATFTEGYGSVINGPFGEGQWFYQETRSQLDARTNQYPYNPERAIELLEEDGWVLDANGNDYAGEGLRHKEVNGELMALELEWGGSEQNAFTDLLLVRLAENPDLLAAGMKINQTTMTFPELMNWQTRDVGNGAQYGVPQFHMFNLATNFSPWYDLTNTYEIGNSLNRNFISDEELQNLAAQMVLRGPEDRDGFKEDFVSFIERWNYLLPDIPLYSNIYHDFFNDKIQNWQNNSNIRTHQVVLYAYVDEGETE